MTEMPLATSAGLLPQLGRADYPDHTYTYLFCDLRTDELLAELPLTGVTYSTELNGVGTLRGTIPYSDETLPLDPETATIPGRTAVYVDRDGVLVWGGIVWTRQPTTGGKTIQASEFLSYYQRRYVTQTLSNDLSNITNTEYVPDGQRIYLDQRYIVWSLLVWANGQPGGNIGIDTVPLSGATGPTGITRQATYWAHERPEIYRAIQELSQAENGFDFGVEIGWTQSANNVPPRRYKRARVWYPRRGRSFEESGLVFSKGGAAGNVLDYDWPEDGTALATATHGLGDGNGPARLTATATASEMLAAGWPLLEAVTTYQGVADPDRLQANTNAELTARSRADVQPTFEVSADADPAFGSYSVGDEALFVIDPEPQGAPAGRSAVLRILSIETTAATGPERVRLTCTAV